MWSMVISRCWHQSGVRAVSACAFSAPPEVSAMSIVWLFVALSLCILVLAGAVVALRVGMLITEGQS